MTLTFEQSCKYECDLPEHILIFKMECKKCLLVHGFQLSSFTIATPVQYKHLLAIRINSSLQRDSTDCNGKNCKLEWSFTSLYAALRIMALTLFTSHKPYKADHVYVL